MAFIRWLSQSGFFIISTSTESSLQITNCTNLQLAPNTAKLSYLNKTDDPHDPETLKECGTVLNWKGENLSQKCFNTFGNLAEYQQNQTLIEININKLGFLRAVDKNASTITITQYSVDVNGNLLMLMDNNIRIDSAAKVILLTSLATADEGYAILYAKYLSDKSDFMSSLGGLYVSFIGYNTTNTASMGNPILLLQITKEGMLFDAVHCNACFGLCYFCVVSIVYNKIMHYEEIIFCSVTIIGSGQLFNTPNETGVPWNVVSSTPVGGYVFSAVDNANHLIYIYDIERHTNYSKVNLTYFGTAGIGTYSILKNNNSLLFSLRDINGKNTSWSLLAVQLPETLNCMFINTYS
ncbi:3642_t:CDS:2 [Dentiscutata erythropus]|uniref:3642_t:CDS:1 n=1 Tax=Dentiscutata erythropus TaxID=1348616 RepID=A0A9N9EZR7_9GLOM|nr:3642_t:CDS:2 [Dentiscutata erythropus]